MQYLLVFSLFVVLLRSYNLASDELQCTESESFCNENGTYYKEICKTDSCKSAQISHNEDYPYFVLPRINLEIYKNGSKEEKEELITSFDSYLNKFGILTVYNHGIDNKLLDDILLHGKEFFDKPLLEKLKYKITTGNSGYDTFKWISAARSYGIPEQPLDLMESFARYERDGADIDGVHIYGPTDGPEYILNITNIYIQKINDVLHIIHEIAALSLGLDINYFNDRYKKRDATQFRMQHFPYLNMLNVNKQQMRLSQHYDFLGFNLFFNENVRGLQTKIGDIWIDAKPLSKYDIIVNVGELLKIWTNKHWKACFHRVIPQTQRRLTLTFFSSPDYDTLIAPIKECTVCMENKEELFEGRTVREHEQMLWQQTMQQSIYT